MAAHGRTAGTANFARRTWDKDAFAEKARERAEREAAGDFTAEGKAAAAPYRAAPAGAKGPAGSERAFLTARDHELHLEAKLGKKLVVADTTPAAQRGGFWCEVCQCSLTDSSAWLSHIGGIKHQRRLGFSMRVERSSVDDVLSKLASTADTAVLPGHMARDVETKRPRMGERLTRYDGVDEEDHAAAMMRASDEERADRRGQAVPTVQLVDEDPSGRVSQVDVHDADEPEEDDFAAVMGFSGFAGTGKKH